MVWRTVALHCGWGGGADLHVALQLVDGHGEVWVVVVVKGHVPARLVQHGEERAHAAEPGEVHDVLHLGGMFQGLDHQASGGEIRLQDGSCISLYLGEGHNMGGALMYNQLNTATGLRGLDHIGKYNQENGFLKIPVA